MDSKNKKIPREIDIKNEFIGVGGASIDHLNKGQTERYNSVFSYIKDVCLRGKIPKHSKRKVYDDFLMKYKYFIVYGTKDDKE